MASNILRSLEPTRKAMLATIAQQPEIRRDLEFPDLDEHLIDLEAYSDRLIAQRDRFHDLHKLLLTASSDDEALQQDILLYVQKDAEMLMESDTIVAKYTTVIKGLSRKRTYSMTNGSESSASVTPTSPVKLPKLQLVPFDGTILNWHAFWDSFSASVHNNTSLNDVDKMNYLKSQLHGPAKVAIAGFSSTAANYASAVKLLQRRFGDKNIIINAHYAALAALPPAQNGNGKLRETFDVIEQHLNSLQAIGEDVNTSQMISMLKLKLPVGVIIRLEEQYGIGGWNIDKLREGIHTYLSIRESAEHGRMVATKIDLPSVKPKFSRVADSSPRRIQSTTEALISASSPSKRCSFCHKDTHWSTDCKRYSTIEARKAQVKGQCFNCLKMGHILSECPRTKPCFYCKAVKVHHSSLCPQGLSKTLSTAVTVTDDTTATDTTKILSILASGETVMLQTAKAQIRSTISDAEFRARILLDTGSHRSYITQSLADRLKLTSLLTEQLRICTFGNDKPRYISSATVELKMKLLDGSYMTLQANVIPTITGSFTRAAVNLTQIQTELYCNLSLADSIPATPESVEPDFLLGNDYYWDIVTCEKVDLGKGLYLIGSKLGWILTGRQPTSRSTHQLSTLSTSLMVCNSGVTTLAMDFE